ncbi:PREDICTED: HIV Tat-specific factor 1 [Nicrophorus vespilloides]|uniref:HIV Tat-specific factor 1 n=1 Tax=Nicrophorus vespilloides TaxID=110193 RepID=A0ABM1MFF7_NICVS|nr:PREDICTED: HIV Tat-specific factor 1 [Nicrophorus vespilloides]
MESENSNIPLEDSKVIVSETDVEKTEETENKLNSDDLKVSEDNDIPANYDPKDVYYEGEVAIYKDPKSGYQYKWDKEKNEWVNHVIYGFEDDTHTYTDSDGVTFFWDKDKSAWFPKINDLFMAQYQMNYGFVDNTTKPEPKKAAEPSPAAPPSTEEKKPVKRKASEPAWFEPEERKNTKVYVSNLPLDITEDEFAELMQKCGIIMRDPVSNKLKIKLYTEPGSTDLKGDGLCTYIRIESVDLALKLLDGYDFKGKVIKVEQAKFQLKGQYDPKLKPKSKKRKDKDKLKKKQSQLFDWRPEKMRGERAKHEKIVIVKNVFESKMFDDDVGLILELQEDLREECSKCGEVKKVVIFDRHPEGVAQINMTEPENADQCVALLNGRWFGKRQLSAEIWDGKTKFKIAETDTQINARIDNWEKFLEEDDDKKVVSK